MNRYFSPMRTVESMPFPHLPGSKNCNSRRKPGQNNTFQQKVIDNLFVNIRYSYLAVSRKSVDTLKL